MRGIDHFGLIAPFYDKVIQGREAEQFLEHVSLPTEGALLDAGGGTGRVSQVLVGQADSIVIADLSIKMLRQARNKNGLETVCSHSEKLPFSNEYFDRVIMVDALHHVCNHADTAAELWRVIKTGGRIVIEEPDYRRFEVKLLALLEKLLLMRSRFLAPEQIRALFKYPKAKHWIENDGFNAWVIIEKLP